MLSRSARPMLRLPAALVHEPRSIPQISPVRPFAEALAQRQQALLAARQTQEAAPRTHQPPIGSRWSWLADTYWYVPPVNLPAVVYDPTSEVILPVSDQTVFHITGFRGGYFWGVTVSQLQNAEPTCSTMVGSVTPEGRVLINFTLSADSTSPTITQGIGQMRPRFGQWTMENQMFSNPSGQPQVGHWAYMVQTRPGLPSWESLPGVGVSVPEFLSHCPDPGPQPIGPPIN